jgi:hypothetical protein
MITPEHDGTGNPVPRATLVQIPQNEEAFMGARLFPNLAASSIALAVALAASGASGQTVITRSISAEPVETTMTQTPSETVVTRRPVDGQVVQPGVIAKPTLMQRAPIVVETVPDTVDAITTREVVRRAEATRVAAPLITRDVAARKGAAHTPGVRTTTRTTTRATRGHVALEPRERHIVYQTIVAREVVPPIVAREVVPRRQVMVAPPRAVAPSIVQPQVTPAARPPIVAADDIELTVAPIAVGSVLPENVPLYAIPQHVALTVPATRPYSYAWLGGRAYLVEPASGTVVADVTE